MPAMPPPITSTSVVTSRSRVLVGPGSGPAVAAQREVIACPFVRSLKVETNDSAREGRGSVCRAKRIPPFDEGLPARYPTSLEDSTCSTYQFMNLASGLRNASPMMAAGTRNSASSPISTQKSLR